MANNSPTTSSQSPNYDQASLTKNKRLHHWLLIGLLTGLLSLGVVVSVGLGWWWVNGQKTSPVTSAPAMASTKPVAIPPALAEVWRNRDWLQAISMLEEMQQQTPDSSVIQSWLSQAHLQQAISQRHKGLVKMAQSHLEQALALTPEQWLAKQEFELGGNYLRGVEHYEAGRWPEAITAFESVWQIDPDYAQVADLLYSAYYNQGLAQQAAGEQWLRMLQISPTMKISMTGEPITLTSQMITDTLTDAQDLFEAAIALRPALAEPRWQLAQLALALTDSEPVESYDRAVADKLIVVGIAEQRMWVYEGNDRVFDFVVSTGEPGRETAIGDFEILNKIDMAYASTWNLDMPYWLGIYWAGPLQNGIHALPTVRHTGYTLWDGFLGQRVSYGCVILSLEDAATLYNWVDVGVEVKIVSSLHYWSTGTTPPVVYNPPVYQQPPPRLNSYLPPPPIRRIAPPPPNSPYPVRRPSSAFRLRRLR